MPTRTEGATCRTRASAEPDLSGLPPRVDRRVGADLVTMNFFPVSARTLEAWPLAWRRVNGRALCETAELFALARSKLEAAPPIRAGRGTRAPVGTTTAKE